MLEMKVIYHGPDGTRQIAGLHIIQTKKGRGNERTYGVSAFRYDMLTEQIVKQVGVVADHDRTLPVWELIRQAIEWLEP